MTGQEYKAQVAGLRCLVCVLLGSAARPGSESHHVGEPWERSDWLTVPLCTEHHRGGTGVHGMHRKKFHTFYKLSDMQMLASTISQIMRGR